MRKSLVFVLTVLLTATTASAQLTDLTVSGGSFTLFQLLVTDPAIVNIQTISNDPTQINAVTSAPSPVGISLSVSNSTGVDWTGFAFDLEGATFDVAPTLTFGDAIAVLNPAGDAANLSLPVAAGTSTSIELRFSTASSAAGLTITPIIPEPAIGVAMLLTPLLISRRSNRC